MKLPPPAKFIKGSCLLLGLFGPRAIFRRGFWLWWLPFRLLAQPIIVSPADHSTLTDPLTVTWTADATSTGDYFLTVSTNTRPLFRMETRSLSMSLPTGTLPATGEPIYATVQGWHDVGGWMAGPRMTYTAPSGSPPPTTTIGVPCSTLPHGVAYAVFADGSCGKIGTVSMFGELVDLNSIRAYWGVGDLKHTNAYSWMVADDYATLKAYAQKKCMEWAAGIP